VQVLIHGADERIEAALHEHDIEPVRDGEADALVTIAPAAELRLLAEVAPEQWLARFREWVEEPFWAFQAWLRGVLDRGTGGGWVAITSTLGAQPFPGGGPDGTAAVTLQTLVRAAALEYGSRGLRANAIAPGWRDDALPAELDRALAVSDTPTGRLTSASDVAAATAWLLSDDARQVNGEILRVDGGYTITRGSRPDPAHR
jgi:NAD(P)-dependent dehydrogenase (short-subunit alcohol dehydrogenase family)